MQHKFVPSSDIKDCPQCILFPPKCASCTEAEDTCMECEGRKLITDHVFHQSCERCNQVKDCTFFPKLNKTVCNVCAGLFIREMSTIDREKVQLDAIQSNGDFFNAEVMSFASLKKELEADETITDKVLAFQKLLAERIEHFSKTIFDADKVKFEAHQRKLAAQKTLRDFGADIRKEIQEQLKASDAKYVPVQQGTKKVKPVSIGKKLNAFDKMVQSFAVATGKSFDEAKLILEQGNKK